MTDVQIIELYWLRDERAIGASDEYHGAACMALSQRILNNREDAEECVNDTWLRSWNAIPPTRPVSLRAFFLKIVRNLSLNCMEKNCAQKRGGDQTAVLLDELKECVPSGEVVEDIVMARELSSVISEFLSKQSKQDAALFLQRYFYLLPLSEAAEKVYLTETVAAMRLSRIRKKLRMYLKEVYDL